MKVVHLLIKMKLEYLQLKPSENTPENVESTGRYPLKKAKPPPYIGNYVTQSETGDLVNHVNFCNALNVMFQIHLKKQ